MSLRERERSGGDPRRRIKGRKIQRPIRGLIFYGLMSVKRDAVSGRASNEFRLFEAIFSEIFLWISLLFNKKSAR